VNDHQEAGSVFKGVSPTTKNDLIQTVREVTLDDISRQIQEAPYISVSLHMTSDTHVVSQLVTVLSALMMAFA
jgi:hypothetical protein